MLTASVLLIFCTRIVMLFRTSTCLRDHEEFSLCGWRCPPTCVNLRMLATDMCPSTWDCRVGCRCSAGFVRDEYSKQCVLVENCPGAPTYSEGEQPRYVNKQQIQQIEEFLRERRAPYHESYVSPCASAGAIQYPVSSVPIFSAPSYQGYGVPQYGYAPRYRSVDEQPESELLGFSDMDQVMQGHVPMARLGGYGAAGLAGVSPVLSGAGGRVLNQGTSGTALGVFPNANVGRCSVPLLFSCSPNIVPGHLAESQYHAAPAYGAAVAATADSYRLVDEPVQHEAHDKHEGLLTQEHVNHEPNHAAHQ